MLQELNFVKYINESTDEMKIIIFCKEEKGESYKLFKFPELAIALRGLDNVFKFTFSIRQSCCGKEIINRLLEYNLIKESDCGIECTYVFKYEFLESMPNIYSFIKRNYCFQFKIGDIVRIVDYGEVYSSYYGWRGLLSEYHNQFVMSSFPPENDDSKTYRILNIDLHGGKYHDFDILVLIQDIETERVYIISERGIKKIQTAEVEDEEERQITQSVRNTGYIV